MKILFRLHFITARGFLRSVAALFLVLAWMILSTGSAMGAVTVVGYWRLGENDPGAVGGRASTNTTDATGAENLKVYGPASYSTDVSADAFNHTSSSLSVNFTNGAYASNAVVSTAVNNFGVECWVKPAAVSGTSGQVIVYNGSTATSGWGIIIGSDNTYKFLYGGLAVQGTNVVVTNVWTHLALVCSGGQTTLYVNGAAMPMAVGGPATPASGFAIGAPPQAPTSQFFTGLVDEVRVFTFSGAFNTNDLLLYRTNYTVGVNSRLEGPGSGVDSIALNVYPPSATWTATTNAPWLHLAAGKTSGTNSANVAFSFDANPGATRSNTLTIANQTILVMQAGSNYVAARPITTLATGYNYTYGLRVDASGNVYFAANSANAIFEWLAASGAVSNVASSGLSGPTDVALDAAGNLYIADYQNNAVKEQLATNGNIITLVGSGLDFPQGVAVDSADNVYIANSSPGAIKERLSSSGSVVTPISGLSQPTGVAVDFARNIYYLDEGTGVVGEWLAASSNVVQLVSGLSYPFVGLAVDGSGDIYIADTFHFSVKKRSAADGSVNTLVNLGSEVSGVAVDSNRNVYYSDTGNGAIKELPYAFVDPSPKFEPMSADGGDLSVLPATENLAGPFAPVSDQPWLTINSVTGGNVNFTFTATTAGRIGHINLLGQSIPVIQGIIGTPPILKGVQSLGQGSVQFTFTNLPGAVFEVLSSTNLALPISQWTVVGSPSLVGSSQTQYQFTSAPDTNDAMLFFTVRSP